MSGVKINIWTGAKFLYEGNQGFQTFMQKIFHHVSGDAWNARCFIIPHALDHNCYFLFICDDAEPVNYWKLFDGVEYSMVDCC